MSLEKEPTSEMIRTEAKGLLPPGSELVVEGRREGAWVWDLEGRRFLDCVGGRGLYNLGRRHPALVETLRAALHQTDQGNFPMISKEKADLAQALTELVDGGLEGVVFGVMRGEAMDFACKVARGFTERRTLVTVDGGWYGETGFALTLSAREDKGRFGPLIPGVRTIAQGDLEAAHDALTTDAAALIIEPIQAENHCRTAEHAYLRGLQQLCHKNGTLLVFDETQTGFGRTGARFASSLSGVVPDILVLGEALGGGLFPISATLLTARVKGFMDEHPLIHLSTFGGSDLGCRVAARALELYQELEPWRNARQQGRRVRAVVAELAATGAGGLRSVAGEGLLLSLELADPAEATRWFEALAAEGVLVARGEVARHTIVLRPSLLLMSAEADELIRALRAVARG